MFCANEVVTRGTGDKVVPFFSRQRLRRRSCGYRVGIFEYDADGRVFTQAETNHAKTENYSRRIPYSIRLKEYWLGAPF